MKSFLTNVIGKLQALWLLISHWPVIEPILEVLHYQRTIVLAAGFAGMKIVPILLPDLNGEQTYVVRLVIMLLSLVFFLGLQKEVLKEAEQALSSLPTTEPGYFIEFTQQLIKAFQNAGKTNVPLSADPLRQPAG